MKTQAGGGALHYKFASTTSMMIINRESEKHTTLGCFWMWRHCQHRRLIERKTKLSEKSAPVHKYLRSLAATTHISPCLIIVFYCCINELTFQLLARAPTLKLMYVYISSWPRERRKASKNIHTSVFHTKERESCCDLLLAAANNLSSHLRLLSVNENSASVHETMTSFESLSCV